MVDITSILQNAPLTSWTTSSTWAAHHSHPILRPWACPSSSCPSAARRPCPSYEYSTNQKNRSTCCRPADPRCSTMNSPPLTVQGSGGPAAASDARRSGTVGEGSAGYPPMKSTQCSVGLVRPGTVSACHPQGLSLVASCLKNKTIISKVRS